MTQNKLQQQAWMIAPATTRVMTALDNNARFVGGSVRNALLNRDVVDVDITTPLKPHEIIAALDHAGIKHLTIGIQHGTITALVDGQPFEITTLREDVQTDGRHAQVEFTCDWEKDAARRDFTMNAMSCTVEGEIFDYFDGLKDLHAGRVRFVGDAKTRIEEDVLRILRFFRFYAHYGHDSPDKQGLAACKELAHLIPNLSVERVRDETLKLLSADNAAATWQVMRDAKIIDHILPKATHIGDLARLIGLELALGTGADPLRRLACLLNQNAKDGENTARDFKLSGNQTARLKAALKTIDTIHPALDEKQAHYLIFKHGHEIFIDQLLINTARHEDHKEIDKMKTLFEIADSWQPPPFQLTGTDVMELGIPAGPKVGQHLDAVRDWWAGEDFKPNRKACLEALKKQIG